MKIVIERRAQERAEKYKLLHEKIQYNQDVLQLEKKIDKQKDEESKRRDIAATIINAVAKGYLARVWYRILKEEIKATVTIQKVMRGKLGRMRWLKFYYLSISVVKSDSALEEILNRSKLTRECKMESQNQMWREYFDPMTDNFWYFNTRTKLSTWDCPLVLQRDLICFWEGYQQWGGLPSQGPCRCIFDNVMAYQNHVKTAHKWYCQACEHCNFGISFPNCQLCGNKLSEDGIDGESALEYSIGKIKSRLAQFLVVDKAKEVEGTYVLKDRIVQLATLRRNEEEKEREKKRLEEIEEEKRLKSLIKERPKFASLLNENEVENASSTLPPIFNAANNEEKKKKYVLPPKTKPKLKGLKVIKAPEPEQPKFSDTLMGEDGEILYSTVYRAAEAKDFEYTGGFKGEHERFKDPLGQGLIPTQLFEDLITDVIRPDDDDDERTKVISESDDDSELNSLNMEAMGMGLNSDGVCEQKLLVCVRYMKGLCTKTTCPRAHPGVRDRAEIFYMRIPGSAKKIQYCKVCPECIPVNNCQRKMSCNYYHVYIRPSTQELIFKIYPIENGVTSKSYRSGAEIKGNMRRQEFMGYGIFSWANGSVYLGDFYNSLRHGFGIFRCNDGSEYVGQWEEGFRHGWGVMITRNGEEYQGEWSIGKMHGYGRLTNPAGDVYEGMFQNHKYHGVGTFAKSNGDKFMGYCSNGMANGLGILALWTGEKYKGYFDRNFRHGRGACSYPNGGKYVGNWYRGIYDGFGVYLFPNGERYLGQWSGGKMAGHGRYYFKNGDFYDGQFAKGKANGHGVYYSINGNIYTGSWMNDKRNGRGTYLFANGSKYTGNWVDNYMDGKGKFDFALGAYYRGEWKKNVKHGKGIYTWPRGTQYKGEIEQDLLCGTGEMIYSNGHRYLGKWKNSRKNGWGKFFYREGHIYEGDWLDDIRQGKGKLTWLPGTLIEESYDGDWFEDEKHGQGKYIYRLDEGTVYEGEWYRGVRQGKGKITYSDGSYYRGDFRKEQMWGKGVYVGADGTQYDGDWRMNMRHGKGALIASDGTIYHGEFWQNMRHGNGVQYNVDGSIYKGTWEGNLIVGTGIYTKEVGIGPSKEGPEEINVKVFGY